MTIAFDSNAFDAGAFDAAGGVTDTLISPVTGSIAETGHVPAVARTANQSVMPGAGVLAYSGLAPALFQTAGKTIVPGSGALVRTAYAPSLSQSANQSIAAGTGVVVLTAYAPNLSQSANGGYSPSAGQVTLTGASPSITQSNLSGVSPLTGSVSLTGFAPAITATAKISVSPWTGALQLTGTAPSVVRSVVSAKTPRLVAPATGRVVATGLQPDISITELIALPELGNCHSGYCGIGDGNLAQPGDPDNNIALSARKVYGGVLVSWSYPLINGHAVAYTEIYRGVTADPAQSLQLQKAGGSFYLDTVNPTVPTEYYYWIEVVSIHGTRGARIGPVRVIAEPLSKQTLEILTGLIDKSYLAETLKEEISGITFNGHSIAKEVEDRLRDNLALQNALSAVQGELDEALTYVLQETTARADADSAIVQQVNAIAAGLNENAAAIVEERTVRVTKDEAIAQQMLTLVAETGSNTAAIIAEQTARTTADSSMAQGIDLLYAVTSGNSAAIAEESRARSTAVSAVASRITTVESTVNGNVATGQTGLKTQIDTLTGRVSSMWYAKVQVNGLIGGFGINNDGQVVDAGFDVDRFWVGRTGPDKVKPFIVSGGVVYIDKARIRNADIDTLKIAGNSVMTGVYDSGGGASVGAGGSANLITRTLDLGDGNNSGVIVSATVSVNGGSNATVGFRVLINGQVAGDQRASILSGFGYLFPVAGFAAAGGSRYVIVTLQAYNPTSGGGANVGFNVTGSTIAIMGGKR